MGRHDLSPLIAIGCMSAILLLIHAVLTLSDVRPVLNFTVSAPRGLYLVMGSDIAELQRGQLIRMAVPKRFVAYVYGRHWLKAGTPLLKTVGGLAGDIVCVHDRRFSLNGRDLGPVSEVDSEGLALPVMHGCSVVPAGHFVPVSTFHQKSFDGRYMGAVPVGLITGRAVLLWTF